MNIIINWICLISITLLVLDVMIYFCNDAIKMYNKSTKVKAKTVEKQELTYMKIRLQNKNIKNFKKVLKKC